MKSKFLRQHLKKELTLFDAVAYGIGVIIGAGVYALVGKGAGLAGNALWLSFIIGSIVALLSGFSYAELSSAFSKDAAEYHFARYATKNRMFSFVVGWLTIFAGISAMATVSVGFAGYFSELTGMPAVPVAILLILLCALVNLCGLKFSTRLITITSLIQVLGLLFVIGLGLSYMGKFGTVNAFDFSFGAQGIISAASLMFFAFIGFEGISNMSEEINHAKSVVPKALILSILITTIIYVLIAITAVNVVGYKALSSSDAPLALAAETASEGIGLSLPSGTILSIIALFATGSTVLVGNLITSRILYGMRDDRTFPKSWEYLQPKNNVPYVCIMIVSIMAIILATLGNISLLANLTNFAVFTAFFSVNFSLLVLRFDSSFTPKFRAPLSIGKLPLTGAIGAISCAILLSESGPTVITYGSLLILAGIIFFMARNGDNTSECQGKARNS
ncbi:Amino acid permease [uncultured archaeon]|nr:Amino acid permease [uncultured archaeon]